ncbi:MAG: hypothetical protein QUS33_05985 [Dehalococcoidia bacterium]|nr:hypothetical protein [Dehalococcoidia bacterium]
MITTSMLETLLWLDLAFSLAAFYFFVQYRLGVTTYGDIVCGLLSVVLSGYIAIGVGAGLFKSEILGVIVQDNGFALIAGLWSLFMMLMVLLFVLKHVADGGVGVGG